ncbi:SH2 domain containing 3Cb isoform X2 [Amphiprion ocellaris]|uniref:SH2 domain containing 3Cb isoform X2 n=1 Tax=Amphiprion ocellaris TaxID=80972 RepID=UPI0024113E97|nr:SH2 domain containing 3Cb isoform X2 [Amphiprion ocellaris]
MNKRKLSLKWFGSLSNLSTRRQPGKASIKASPGPDISLSGAKPAAGLGDESVDDLESCLRSPGYARSSDMYTHVGTVPRGERQRKKSCRGPRDKKKKKEEEEGMDGGQSRRMDHVRDSPLLGALSSLSLSSMEAPQPASARPLPATPSPSRAPAPGSSRAPPVDPVSSQEALKRKNTAESGGEAAAKSPKATATQDLYVPMDPISESERQRGVTCSQEEQSDGRPQDVTYGGGEYVKFSKEKFWLEPPSEKLRKELEEELKLSGADLKSHAWYHGCIPWEVSESLVANHGDFLIRDSQSSSGDFVLTSRWEQKTLHFLVKKTAVQSSETYTRVHFSLETEAFDSLPALIHFYVGSRETLTHWSGAQIQQPVNRTLPLSYLETAFRTTAATPIGHQGASDGSMSGEEWVCPRSPSSLHHQGADVGQNPAESSVSPPTPQSRSPSSSRSTSVAPSPSPSRRSDTGRPLPSPSGTIHQQHLDQVSASDLVGSCYTELYPGPQSYVERLRAEEGTSPGVEPLRTEDGNVYFCPVVETVSCFRPSRYQSALMHKENKPLQVGILRRVKELLAEVDPRTAAKHITKADCMVARILEVTPEMQRMMGVTSGMELLTLPHGQQLRLDLLESSLQTASGCPPGFHLPSTYTSLPGPAAEEHHDAATTVLHSGDGFRRWPSCWRWTCWAAPGRTKNEPVCSTGSSRSPLSSRAPWATCSASLPS